MRRILSNEIIHARLLYREDKWYYCYNIIFVTSGHVKSACPTRLKAAEKDNDSKHGRVLEREIEDTTKVKVLEQELHMSINKVNKNLGGKAPSSPNPKTPKPRPTSKPATPKVNHHPSPQQSLGLQNLKPQNGTSGVVSPVLLTNDQINAIFRPPNHPQKSAQQSPGGNFVSCLIFLFGYLW